MLVDDIGDMTITDDGVTILKMLEVEHPAVKMDKQSHLAHTLFYKELGSIEAAGRVPHQSSTQLTEC